MTAPTMTTVPAPAGAGRPIPPHGTRACYLRGCRQHECVTANKRYCKAYRLARINVGGNLRVDAAPAIARLHRWSAQGWSHRQIATATGASGRVVHNLLAGQLDLINPATAARILAADVLLTGVPEYTRVPAVGAIRRGRALVAIGYPVAYLAPLVPMAAQKLAPALLHDPEMVQVRTARGVAAAYDRLWDQDPVQCGVLPAIAARTRATARRRGWAPPMAWDDDRIDDPSAEPDLGQQVSRTTAVAEDAAELLTQGYSIELVAERLGLTRSGVEHAIRRAAEKRASGEAA